MWDNKYKIGLLRITDDQLFFVDIVGNDRIHYPLSFFTNIKLVQDNNNLLDGICLKTHDKRKVGSSRYIFVSI